MSGAGSVILAGEFKGQKIPSLPAGLSVRPILARIKKSLFDILKSRIPGSVFLDLFAGSGSVGLEALSRGASKVIFVESNPRCIQRLRENFQKLSNLPSFVRRGQGRDGMRSKSSCAQQAEFHCRDVLSGFSWLGEECDLIFSGAPYVHPVKSAEGIESPFHGVKKQPLFFVQKLLNLFEQYPILKKSGWFIAQHHKKEIFEVPDSWLCFRQERYGDSMLSFFTPHQRDSKSAERIYPQAGDSEPC